jgi:uncharacterized membrane protein
MHAMHLLNIAFHVACGTAAMVVGFMILAADKGTARHRVLGRRFAWLTLAVCTSAAAGTILFRFIPLFAVLTVLVLYQLLGAWRAVHTKADGPQPLDAGMTACAAVAAFMLAPLVTAAQGGSSAVMHATLATLAAVIGYDICRWWFPTRWHAALWRYEHVYKAVASLFGMLSAASGNTIRAGQPWSQLVPSAIGMATILFLMWRNWRRQRILAASLVHYQKQY